MDLTEKDIPRLSDDEELTLEKNTTWFFGSPRGGTSWVGTELLRYNTLILNEPHIEEHLSMKADEIQPEIIRRIDNPQQNPQYFFSKVYKDVWLFYLRKLILHRIFAQSWSVEKKIIIKEVVHFGATEILSQCMPNSKIIFLNRDGRDYVDSLYAAITKNVFHHVKLLGIEEPTHPDHKIWLNGFVSGHSLLWKIRTENFLKCYEQHPKELRYMINYESILEDTLGELKKLYEFLEINIPEDELKKIVKTFDFNGLSADMKGDGKFRRSAQPGRWKKNFSEDEQKIMNDIMGSTLKKIGYEI